MDVGRAFSSSCSLQHDDRMTISQDCTIQEEVQGNLVIVCYLSCIEMRDHSGPPQKQDDLSQGTIH